MPIKMMKHINTNQTGASLIEVLIAILILSFGMLSLAGMLSFSVQMPKLSAYRATAANLASSHVERIRANPEGFAAGSYNAALNETVDWNFNSIAISGSNCSYTGTKCTSTTLASGDTNELRNAVRRDLPAGDILVRCNPATCAQTAAGELWVIWQEPSTFATLDASASDQCPTAATTLYASPKPKPRCLYVRFKVE